MSSLAGMVCLGLLLFVPAGTFDYWQAWVFIGTVTVVTAGPSVYLVVRDPAAIERRMKVGQETRPVQRVLVFAFLVLMPALLVFCALDHRFGWSSVPTVLVLIADAVVAAGLVITMVVVLQNRFAAANIAVYAGQKLVSTGLYGIIRHPMYAGALIMTIGIPVALDSWWGLVAVVPATVILVLRILDEEKALGQDLDGYREYVRETRFRLVPYVW
ncbi:methyltransferase family protein [Luedemannella flava]